MTTQALKLPIGETVKSRYCTIIAKLHATIALHEHTFPQLLEVEDFINSPFPKALKNQDYMQRLEELCAFLYKLGVASYVIRHLHNNVCQDVEAVISKTFLINPDKTYITIPR